MTKTGDSAGQEILVAQLALQKLVRVLGIERGTKVYKETLLSAGLAQLETPQQLYAFGLELSKLRGFEAAVGSMLMVSAVMRGATGTELGY